MPGAHDSAWRYGVALFPVPPLLSLAALGSLRAFVSMTGSESLTESGVLVGLAAFVLSVLGLWLAVLVALVVAVSVFMDARALAGAEPRTPNPYVFGGVGLVHLAGTELLVLNLLSVPSFVYYLYRRRRRVS